MGTHTHTYNMENVQTPYTNVAPARSSKARTVLCAVGVAASCVASFMAGSYHESSKPVEVAPKFMASRPLTQGRVARLHAAPAPAPEPVDETPAAPAFDLAKEAGVLPPTGFFDPAGLAKDKGVDRLRYFQEAETKHGRVAMLAALGFLVGESFHPLFGGDIDVPSYVAFQATPLQTFWPLVLVVIGAIENFQISKFQEPDGESLWKLREDYEIGNLGWDPAGLKPKTPAALKTMKAKELQNGRLAMLGIAGMVAQELVNGQKVLGGAASAADLPDVSPEHIFEIAKEMSAALSQ